MDKENRKLLPAQGYKIYEDQKEDIQRITRLINDLHYKDAKVKIKDAQIIREALDIGIEELKEHYLK